MNEPANSVDTLTVEILILKQQTAQNIIEIGKRLNQVKEQLPHGEWQAYLETKVDISYRSAVRLMQVAREFSNVPTLAGLPSSKVFALLDLPEPDREPFLSEPHVLPNGETKTVDEMTTRELQQAIKARKEAERKTEEAESRANSLAKSLEVARTKAAAADDIESDNETLRAANHVLETKLKSAGDPIIVEQPVQVVPPDYERIKAELAVLKAKHTADNPEFKQYSQQVESDADLADKIINALMTPQLVSTEGLSHSVQCYLEYSPGTVNDALMDCDRSIDILQNIKQAFSNMTKLKVVKK